MRSLRRLFCWLFFPQSCEFDRRWCEVTWGLQDQTSLKITQRPTHYDHNHCSLIESNGLREEEKKKRSNDKMYHNAWNLVCGWYDAKSIFAQRKVWYISLFVVCEWQLMKLSVYFAYILYFGWRDVVEYVQKKIIESVDHCSFSGRKFSLSAEVKRKIIKC